MRHSENTALFLRKRRADDGSEQQRSRCCEHAQIPLHGPLPPVQERGLGKPIAAPCWLVSWALVQGGKVITDRIAAEPQRWREVPYYPSPMPRDRARRVSYRA